MNQKLRDFVVEKIQKVNRTGTDKLIEFLDNSDFFTAPASTKYHGAYEGGLAEHSVNVLDTMLALDEMLYNVYGMPKDDISSITIVALCHDLCKTNTYKSQQLWRKDENGKWESYTGYVREPELPMGHGPKSVYLLQKTMPISDYEAQAILYHMGAYDVSDYMTHNEIGEAFSKNSLAYKLHTADMMATYVLENENIAWVTK